MDFLIDLNIKKDTIENIKKLKGNNIEIDIKSNKEEITNIINYFKKLGINNIDELLIYELDTFFQDYDYIKENITSNTVEQINDDYTYIENLI